MIQLETHLKQEIGKKISKFIYLPRLTALQKKIKKNPLS
jgi:hypothetical protein